MRLCPADVVESDDGKAVILKRKTVDERESKRVDIERQEQVSLQALEAEKASARAARAASRRPQVHTTASSSSEPETTAASSEQELDAEAMTIEALKTEIRMLVGAVPQGTTSPNARNVIFAQAERDGGCRLATSLPPV